MNQKVMYDKTYENSSLEEQLEFVKRLNKASEYEKALHYYLILKNDFLKRKQYEKVMDCLSGICQSLGHLGRVDEIDSYLSEYKMYCAQHGDDLAKLKLNGFIGYLNASIEDYETAIYHYKEALSIAYQLENAEKIKKITYLLINLQSVYLDLNKFEEAIQCSTQLKQIYKEDRKVFSKFSYCAYLLNYMTALIEMNDIRDIPDLMTELQSVEQYEKLKREQMYANYLKGLYYEKLQLNKEAISYFKESLVNLELTKEQPYYNRVLKSLIRILKKQGNFLQALSYSEKLINVLDNNERKKLQIKTIELSKSLQFDEMQTLVYVDSLTNIHNRRYLEIQGANWIERAMEENSPLVCAIFDVDNFKHINDELGHIAGDEVIKQIADRLQDYSEENMLCARFGGDEFVVLARAKQQYEQVFHTLFEKLTSRQYEYNGIFINVDISMGVSSLQNASAKDLSGLIKVADKLLYESKNLGKNRITLNI